MSLFEKDKLLFSILIFTKILHCEGKTDLRELRYLYVGGQGSSTDSEVPQTLSFLSEKQYLLIREIEEIFECFKGLEKNLESNKEIWEQLMNSQTPGKVAMPL